MRVLGRVERFRDRLQLEVRSLEAAPRRRPGRARAGDAARRGRARRLPRVPRRRDRASRACAATVERFLADDAVRERLRALPATPDGHHGYAGGLLEHTVGVATLCRETAQLHPRLRADLLLAAALLHDVGRTLELEPGPAFRADRGGPAARPRPPRPAADRGARRRRSTPAARAELLHAVAVPPRRPRGAHGRGGRALPREPARRGRRDASGRAVALTAVAARARREPRRGASPTSSAVSRAGALPIPLVMLAFTARRARLRRDRRRCAGSGPPATSHLVYGLLAGVAGAVGLGALYQGDRGRGDEHRRADRGDRRRSSRSRSASRRGDRPSSVQAAGIVLRARRRRARLARGACTRRAPTRGSPPGSGSACSRRSCFGSSLVGARTRRRERRRPATGATLMLRDRRRSPSRRVRGRCARRACAAAARSSAGSRRDRDPRQHRRCSRSRSPSTRGLISVVAVLSSLFPVVRSRSRRPLHERLSRIQPSASRCDRGAALSPPASDRGESSRS